MLAFGRDPGQNKGSFILMLLPFTKRIITEWLTVLVMDWDQISFDDEC